MHDSIFHSGMGREKMPAFAVFFPEKQMYGTACRKNERLGGLLGKIYIWTLKVIVCRAIERRYILPASVKGIGTEKIKVSILKSHRIGIYGKCPEVRMIFDIQKIQIIPVFLGSGNQCFSICVPLLRIAFFQRGDSALHPKLIRQQMR